MYIFSTFVEVNWNSYAVTISPRKPKIARH